jgi:hypothetical protein
LSCATSTPRCGRTSTNTRSALGIFEINPWKAKDLLEHGQPVEGSCGTAVTMVGQVMWELIEALDDESIYARFLAEKGEGVHPSP